MARVGGALAAGYRAAGHQVEILERREVGELAFGEVRLSALAFAWPRVARRLDAFDLVHLHGPAPAFADVFLLGCLLRRALRRRVPPLLYSHNFEVHFPGPLSPLGRLYERATLALARRAARRIVVSTEQFRQRLPRNELAVVVPWGCDHRPLVDRGAAAVDTLGSAGATNQELRLLFVGQMRPYKGLPVLLDALRAVAGVTAKIAAVDGAYRPTGGDSRARGRTSERSSSSARSTTQSSTGSMPGPMSSCCRRCHARRLSVWCCSRGCAPVACLWRRVFQEWRR